jgi:hypothetical protein
MLLRAYSELKGVAVQIGMSTKIPKTLALPARGEASPVRIDGVCMVANGISACSEYWFTRV